MAEIIPPYYFLPLGIRHNVFGVLFTLRVMVKINNEFVGNRLNKL